MIRLNFFLFLFLIFTNTLFCQCFKNKVNCSYGCGRHIDSNRDGYCDYTEFTGDVLQKLHSKIDTISNKSEVAASDTILNSEKKNKEHKSEKPLVKTNKSSEANIKTNSIDHSAIEVVDKSSQSYKIDNKVNIESLSIKQEKPYDLILISLITILFYFFTLILFKFKRFKKSTHRKIWNVILLITFLVSCLFGFFLVIQINYNIVIKWFSTILYWHVQVGISMTIISIFHIWWHLKYFKNIFKNNKSIDNCK